MFARSAVSCEAGGGCSADFTDRCHSCTLSLCGLCLESHACTPYAPLQYVTFDGPLVEATPPSKEHFVHTPLTSSNSSSASSSSSATSTSSSSSLTKSVTNFDVPIAKKRKTAAAVLVREPIRNYFSTSQTAPLYNSSDVTLVTAKSNSTMSWVWESFLKFDPVKPSGNEELCLSRIWRKSRRSISYLSYFSYFSYFSFTMEDGPKLGVMTDELLHNNTSRIQQS